MTKQNENKLKRAFWLAFQASTPMGLGFLHVGAAGAQTEDSLFTSNPPRDGKIYTDYVHGRMMKTTFDISEDGVLSISPEKPRADYNSWASTYRTAQELIDATEESLRETKPALDKTFFSALDPKE